MIPFENRTEAGKYLAERLKNLVDENAIVLAIPRGGVVVGFEVAKELDLPLDVIILKKLGAPGNEELAIGAVTSDGGMYINREVARYVGADEGYIRREVERKMAEAREREKLYRGNRPPAEIENRTVIVVDDGVATGSTFIAAINALRSRKPGKIIAAIPVAPPEAFHHIREAADEVVCLHTTGLFFAVGQFYLSFDQTGDEEVVDLLKRSILFGKKEKQSSG